MIKTQVDTISLAKTSYNWLKPTVFKAAFNIHVYRLDHADAENLAYLSLSYSHFALNQLSNSTGSSTSHFFIYII